MVVFGRCAGVVKVQGVRMNSAVLAVKHRGTYTLPSPPATGSIHTNQPGGAEISDNSAESDNESSKTNSDKSTSTSETNDDKGHDDCAFFFFFMLLIILLIYLNILGISKDDNGSNGRTFFFFNVRYFQG